MTVALIIIGLLTGLLTGFTGASGMSVLISGLLLAGMDVRDVIGLTFAVTFTNSLSAIGPYLKQKSWDPFVTWTIGIPACAAVFVGNMIGQSTPSKWLTIIIIISLLGAGIRFLRGGRKSASRDAQPRRAHPVVLCLVGLVIGSIMGIMGGGGSIFISLLLIIGLRLPVRTALGSSIIIMGLAALPGIAINFHQAHIDPVYAACLIIPGAIAAVLAGSLAHLVSERRIEQAIGIYLVAISMALIYTRLIM